jgi:PAS domain S-box-containing protein
MIRIRDLSIRKKLILIIMSTSAAAVLFGSLFLYLMIIKQYQHLYRSDLAGLARVVGDNCEAALAFDIPEDAHKVLSSLSARPSINSASIYDIRGQLFAAYSKGRSDPESSTARESGYMDEKLPIGFLEIDQEIMLDDNVIGRIRMRDDMRSIHTFRRMAVLFLAVAVTITLCITFLFVSRLQKVISEPVTSLASLAGQVSKSQNYALRAEKFGEDEVGHLVETFNAMLSQIQERNVKLLESERRFRTLVDQAVDAFFLYDFDGNFVDVNQRACESLGYTREELLALNVTDVETVVNGKHAGDKYWRAVEFDSSFTIEAIHHRKDGTMFSVEVQLGLLGIGDEKVIMGLARDITTRKLAEQEKVRLENQLQQAQKMESIGTLAGGIAHDFNNILMPIFGYIELAMNTLPKGSATREYLDQVYQAAKRAKDLVKQILTFSRQKAQGKTAIQVHVIIKEALKLLRASIPTTIEIEQHFDSDCGYVLASPTQIHQVMMNLCTNAYQAMRDSGGVLSVSLAPVTIARSNLTKDIHLKAGKYLRLEISDTGHGMDPATQARIFEPYFTTKPPGEGTGMGLSVVHGIVKSHDGHITVNSEPGKGTTFSVYLPTIEAEVQPPTVVDENIPRGDENVLIVDDDEDLLNMMQHMLENVGYRVKAFTDPRGALHVFRKQADRFDLVITDITMPKLTGYQLAQEIMAIRKNIPVIMCTGYSETIDSEKAKAIGIKEYIMKPFSVKEIADAIRRVLDQK